VLCGEKRWGAPWVVIGSWVGRCAADAAPLKQTGMGAYRRGNDRYLFVQAFLCSIVPNKLTYPALATQCRPPRSSDWRRCEV
jgi:hypothetical protein